MHPLKNFSHVWVKYRQLEERQISLPFPEGSWVFSPCPPSSKLKIRVSGNETASRKALFSKMNQVQNSRDVFSLFKTFFVCFQVAYSFIVSSSVFSECVCLCHELVLMWSFNILSAGITGTLQFLKSIFVSPQSLQEI